MKKLIRKILKEQDNLEWAEDSLRGLSNELQEITRRVVKPFDGWTVDVSETGMTFRNQNIIHNQTEQPAEFYTPFDMTVEEGGLTGKFPIFYRDIDNELKPAICYGRRCVLTTSGVSYFRQEKEMTRVEAIEKVIGDINLLLLNNWRYLTFLKDYHNRGQEEDY